MQSKNQDESASLKATKPQFSKQELQELSRKIDAISYRNGFIRPLYKLAHQIDLVGHARFIWFFSCKSSQNFENAAIFRINPKLQPEKLESYIMCNDLFMELLLGIGIVFSTLNLCYRTFGSARLGIIFNNFWLLFFIYFALLAYNRKLICKKIPEARAIDVKRGVESSPFLVTIAPFFLTAVLIWWRMTESGIQIPASLYKVMAMMFAFGCASAITLYVYTLSKNLSWLFWGLITLAYLILYSFEFINIGNYYIFTLPLGIVILISGVLANLRFVRSEIV